MPEVSRFLGIIVSLNYREHPPPHFHVRYNEQRALVSIETLGIIEGYLSPCVRGIIVEWASLHQRELMENWNRARRFDSLQPIEPLE